MKSGEAADMVRKMFQATHCMDYKEFVDALYEGTEDAYTLGKFHKMRENVRWWYCELDHHYADKFLKHVMDREA